MVVGVCNLILLLPRRSVPPRCSRLLNPSAGREEGDSVYLSQYCAPSAFHVGSRVIRLSVFLTGGAGGLGKACARTFADRGHAVAVVDRDIASAAAVADEVSGEVRGAEVRPVQCDVSDPAAVGAAWTAAESALGPVDVVVNNAAILRIRRFRDLTLEEWQATLAVNLTGAFLVAQTAVRAWLEEGRTGAIVNVASVAATRAGLSGAVDHGVSKAGLVGLTTHLAVDLGPHGIRVNAVAPSSFFSPLNDERFSRPGCQEAIIDRVPSRRIGEAAEVAAAVVFLGVGRHLRERGRDPRGRRAHRADVTSGQRSGSEWSDVDFALTAGTGHGRPVPAFRPPRPLRRPSRDRAADGGERGSGSTRASSGVMSRCRERSAGPASRSVCTGHAIDPSRCPA